LLLRVGSDPKPNEDGSATGRRAAKEAVPKLREIQSIFASLRGELERERYWRHRQSISGGVQEYIEALSLAYYLEHERLISYEEVQRSLSDDEGKHVCSLLLLLRWILNFL
jgi:predicted translin family RNA/ssDNA-binding protein